jgi:pyruvate, water dikinase
MFLDVYRHRDELYVHPTKVEHRYSPTMHMLHAWEGDDLVPLLESSTTAEILTTMPWTGLDSARMRQGTWNRSLSQAEQVWDEVQAGGDRARRGDVPRTGCCEMIVSRDPRVLQLAEKLLDAGRRAADQEGG